MAHSARKQQRHHRQAVEGWQAHSNVGRRDTGLSFLQTLRDSYPNHHVVRLQDGSFDLEGFAGAGFATCTNEHFDLADVEKRFIDPRHDDFDFHTSAGHVMDDVHFGRAHYVWQGKNFVIYTTKFRETEGSFDRKIKFLLAACDDDEVVADEHNTHIDALLQACGSWTKDIHEEIWVHDQGIVYKSKELYASVESSSWDDVILNPDTKKRLIDDVDGFFSSRALYQSFGMPWKRGMILHGVPGNGKTISIKAIINNLNKRKPHPVPSLYIKSLDHCKGAKYSISNIFEVARRMAPCVLIFEDLDSMVTDKVRSYFLNEVDGLESNDGILMIGSTNHLDRLDPAIANRPSRFDRKYHFKLPGEQERILYCRYWQKKLEEHKHIDFPDSLCAVLAKLTQGFSFAYLKELFVTSLLILARREPHNDVRVGGSSDGVLNSHAAVGRASTNGIAETETGASADASFKEEGEAGETKAPIPIMKINGVDVPVDLQTNALLHMVRIQGQSLLDEMDNTMDRPQRIYVEGDEEWE